MLFARIFRDIDVFYPLRSILDIHKLKSYIFRGGIEKALRPYLWKYLLNYLRWENTDEENRLLIRSRTDRYYALKRQWENLDDDQVSRFGDFKHRRDLIWKDVARTDRSHPFFSRSNDKNLKLLKDILTTYVMYDFDLGYVQGMSDILAPILLVMENEVDAFWCFVGLMDRVVSSKGAFELLVIASELRDGPEAHSRTAIELEAPNRHYQPQACQLFR